MSTNISKLKRDELISRIHKIKKSVLSAEMDKNSDSLRSLLNDLELEIKGMKYGLVFEEHHEKIDEILKTNTPVLTEEKKLLIDNGGEMNFLIEGDNLAALQFWRKHIKVKLI